MHSDPARARTHAHRRQNEAKNGHAKQDAQRRARACARVGASLLACFLACACVRASRSHLIECDIPSPEQNTLLHWLLISWCVRGVLWPYARASAGDRIKQRKAMPANAEQRRIRPSVGPLSARRPGRASGAARPRGRAGLGVPAATEGCFRFGGDGAALPRPSARAQAGEVRGRASSGRPRAARAARAAGGRICVRRASVGAANHAATVGLAPVLASPSESIRPSRFVRVDSTRTAGRLREGASEPSAMRGALQKCVTDCGQLAVGCAKET